MMRKLVIGLAAVAVVMAGSTLDASARWVRTGSCLGSVGPGCGKWVGKRPHYPHDYGYRGHSRRIGSEMQ
jgi:hypothetical protein